MKVAFIQNGQCHMCGATDVRVLCIDSSESEYDPVQLCKPCIDRSWV